MSIDTGSGQASTAGGLEGRNLLVVGVLLVVLGLLAVLFPLFTGVSLALLFGALLLVGGVVHLANAFSARGWTGAVVQVLLAVLYGVAGVAMLANPVLGLTTLTLLLIIYFLVDGVVEIVMGIQLRGEPRWGWVVASGVLSLLVAVLLWVGFPSTAAWAVGLLFGINLLGTGIAMVLLGRSGPARADELTGSLA